MFSLLSIVVRSKYKVSISLCESGERWKVLQDAGSWAQDLLCPLGKGTGEERSISWARKMPHMECSCSKAHESHETFITKWVGIEKQKPMSGQNDRNRKCWLFHIHTHFPSLGFNRATVMHCKGAWAFYPRRVTMKSADCLVLWGILRVRMCTENQPGVFSTPFGCEKEGRPEL